MKTILRSRRGSTLIWALIMMLVLGILITGGLAIASSYSNRSVDQHVKKQSYYTALSVTKAVAEWLSGTSEDKPTENRDQLDLIRSIISDNDGGNSTTINTSEYASMGQCDTIISYDKDTKYVTVSSTADYNGDTSTVKATLKYSENSVGTGGNPSEVNLMEPPSSAVITEAEDPNEASEEATTVADRQILKEMDIDVSESLYYLVENKFSTSAALEWKNQYYKLNVSGGDNKTNVFVKIVNGDFPTMDTAGNTQNRGVAVCGGEQNFGTNTNSTTIYTNDEDAPTGHIFIMPFFETTISKDTLGFKKLHNTTYWNTHFQINDDGLDENSQAESYLFISNNVTLKKNSTLYTRRNTYINYRYRGYGGMFSSETKEPDLSTTLLKQLEYSNSKNSSPFEVINSSSATIEGRLIVADNRTILNSNTKIYGDVIVQKTNTEQGRLDMPRDKNNTVISGGSIYVKDGGYLHLGAWSGYVYNDIFVEPGGIVDIYGADLRGNIYALGGETTDGKKAVVKATSSIRMGKKDMVLLDGTPVMGGIYLDGETELNKGDGAVLEMAGGSIGNVSGTNYPASAIHAMPGSTVPSSVRNNCFCDALVNGTTKNISRKCSCGIAVPEYGNLVDSWQILKYSD